MSEAASALRPALAFEGVLLLAFGVLAVAAPLIGLGRLDISGVAHLLGAALAIGGLPVAVIAIARWKRPPLMHPGRGHFWRAILGFGFGVNLMVNLDWRANFLETGLILAAILAAGLAAAGWFYRKNEEGAGNRPDWVTIGMGCALMLLALAGFIFARDLRHVPYAEIFGAGAALYGAMLLVSAIRLGGADDAI